MINRKLIGSSSKILPLLIAGTLGIAGCSGEQAGDTNGGMVGGVPSSTVLGVAGGVALAGLLLDSDDDANSAVGGDGSTNGGNGNENGSNNGTNGNNSGNGSNGSNGSNSGNGSNGGNGTNGSNSGGGSTTGEVVLDNQGVVDTQLLESEAVVSTGTNGSGAIIGSNSTGTATTNLTFDRNNGTGLGSVTVSGMSANRVDIMVGPPGANGFVAIALEGSPGDSVWTMPAVLSAAQTQFVLQNINSGNLYIAARTDAFPEGELRRQITPDGVRQFTTTDTNGNGTANGYLLVNEITGDYSITWNTSDASLATAHVNDGVVSGATENDYAPLSQRQSNPARFFRDGNYTVASDPLYSDVASLPERVALDQVWLDAHAADGSRVFLGKLN